MWTRGRGPRIRGIPRTSYKYAPKKGGLKKGAKAAVGVENENESSGLATKQGRQQMNEALNGERRNSGKNKMMMMMMMAVFCKMEKGGFNDKKIGT